VALLVVTGEGTRKSGRARKVSKAMAVVGTEERQQVGAEELCLCVVCVCAPYAHPPLPSSVVACLRYGHACVQAAQARLDALETDNVEENVFGMDDGDGDFVLDGSSEDGTCPRPVPPH
jgi:hypothetical protein